MSVTEPRWLDRLARRAARRNGERGYAPIRVVHGGVSRRTVVRATGAAVALGGVARLLVRPPAARADAFGSFQECLDYNYKLNDYIYDQCAAGPLAAIKAADAAITKAQAAQKTAKTKGQKARQHAIVVQNQVARIKAVDALLDCGFQYAHDRSRSFADCRGDHPPASSGGGGAGGGGGGVGGGGSSSGCGEGTHPCTKVQNVTTCCYGTDTCCGCGGGLCCIYPDCRCCP
ncbi:MAG TPA: hypothetical protein VH231_08995 [Solirubrobacteraceae bacterium]|nr:hypothetical protein [Solirubrobacteraceae bacterium]